MISSLCQCIVNSKHPVPSLHRESDKKTTKREKCRGRCVRVGAPSLGSKDSYVHYSVPVLLQLALFAGFRPYSGVARLFVCITAYKQPLPSLLVT